MKLEAKKREGSRHNIDTEKTPYEIVTPVAVYQKMRHIVDKVSQEVSWLGKVERHGDVFFISDIYLFRQTVTSASVWADAEDMVALTPDLIEQHGKEEALMEVLPNLRAFCHSHVDMNVFWSAADESGINRLGNSQFLISLVLNKKGEMLARLDIFEPFRLTFHGVKFTILYAGEYPELDAEIEEKVTTAPAYVNHTNTRYGARGNSVEYTKKFPQKGSGVQKYVPPAAPGVDRYGGGTFADPYYDDDGLGGYVAPKPVQIRQAKSGPVPANIVYSQTLTNLTHLLHEEPGWKAAFGVSKKNTSSNVLICRLLMVGTPIKPPKHFEEMVWDIMASDLVLSDIKETDEFRLAMCRGINRMLVSNGKNVSPEWVSGHLDFRDLSAAIVRLGINLGRYIPARKVAVK